MKFYIGAAIIAVFIAAIVTELFTRVFPGSYLGLMMAVALAIAFGGVTIAAMDRRAQAIPANRGQRSSRRKGSEEGNEPRGRGTRRESSSRDVQSRAAGRDSSTRAKDTSRRRRPASSGGEAARPAQGPATATAASGGGPREAGAVKWFNRTKGFGFIVRDSGGEIFVHYKSITDPGTRSLRDGQRVTFEVVDHEKGLQAEAVSAGPDGGQPDNERANTEES